jgi:hypothetical protein
MLVFAGLLTAYAVAAAQRGPGGMPRGGPGGGMGGPGGGMNRPPRMEGPPPRNGPQLGPPGRWWDDKKTAKDLNLRPEQLRKMDDVFNANKGQLLNLLGNLQREQQRLESMSREDLQDEGKVFAAIDRVMTAKTELEKENAHVLLLIRKEMDGDQVAALDRGLRQ